ncbi:hypothetical protein QYE76_000237 [Lolium multiflorum]|uniref:Uncharacterized protein n=1 Tax=Lolium multiflorum TaxID=4521 RepID=A0AAD8VW67_LOLMU|nr:hypothetical protein QYE76_000237 [Lolium multiflorum]
MADGTPVTYEDLTKELKKKYDEVKAILEATSSALFTEPAHMASVERVLTKRARWSGPVHPSSTPAASTADQIVPSERPVRHGAKRRTIGYSKPYPNEYELLPPKYRLPDFSKFNGSDGSSSIEHEKQLKLPEGLKLPTAELNGKPYCKWHNSFSHTTNDCRVWRQQIQMAIEQGRLIFNQYAMKVDTHPFPAVNMVECTYPGGCQPGFSFNINMVGPGHHSGKDGDEGSCSRSKDTEEAAPRDRLRHDGKRYITEGEVRNVRYQRPLSDHLLNKYVSQYDQRRRPNDDDERDHLASDTRRHRRHDHDEEEYERRAKEKSREQDDEDRHWDCPFFRHCWDSGMSRLPTIGNCLECRQKRKDAANVSVFQRLGPLPPRNKHAESPWVEDLEDLEDDDEEEEEWDGDEVEVVHADDSAEISTGMNAWEAGQEPLSGINLDDCERIDVTKDGVRLVLSTGLTV